MKMLLYGRQYLKKQMMCMDLQKILNITILTIQQTLLIWILKFLKPYSMMIRNGSML